MSTSEALHSRELTGFQAANSFLRTIHLLEPEMVFALSSIKPAWTNLRTKRLVVPTPETINSNKEHNQYLRRPATEQHLNFLEWLRLSSFVFFVFRHLFDLSRAFCYRVVMCQGIPFELWCSKEFNRLKENVEHYYCLYHGTQALATRTPEESKLILNHLEEAF